MSHNVNPNSMTHQYSLEEHRWRLVIGPSLFPFIPRTRTLWSPNWEAIPPSLNFTLSLVDQVGERVWKTKRRWYHFSRSNDHRIEVSLSSDKFASLGQKSESSCPVKRALWSLCLVERSLSLFLLGLRVREVSGKGKMRDSPRWFLSTVDRVKSIEHYLLFESFRESIYSGEIKCFLLINCKDGHVYEQALIFSFFLASLAWVNRAEWRGFELICLSLKTYLYLY